MLNHHKIPMNEVNKEWEKIKNTINPQIVAKASEIIGEYAAQDMSEFGNITPAEVDVIYLKYRDGTTFGKGIKKIMNKADIRYIYTQRSGPSNADVHVEFWGPETPCESDVVWFADPVNARGTTVLSTMDFLRSQVQFDTFLLSHIVANKNGINAVQTRISDFNIEAFMNYAYQSTHLNDVTGYLKDGLMYIPDFGDKLFDSLGQDYPFESYKQDLRDLIGTQAGRESILRGSILFLLQKRWSEDYIGDRKAMLPTSGWINSSLLWYKILRKLPYIAQKDLMTRNVDIVIKYLERDGFLTSETIPYKKGTLKFYRLTDQGYKFATNVYNPFLVEINFIQEINKDIDHLIYLSPEEIRNSIKFRFD